MEYLIPDSDRLQKKKSPQLERVKANSRSWFAVERFLWERKTLLRQPGNICELDW